MLLNGFTSQAHFKTPDLSLIHWSKEKRCGRFISQDKTTASQQRVLS